MTFDGWFDASIWKWSGDEENLIDDGGSVIVRDDSEPALDIRLALLMNPTSKGGASLPLPVDEMSRRGGVGVVQVDAKTSRTT
jgi:hypothetical protein